MITGWLGLVAILSVLLLVVAAVLQPERFVILLFIVKPFIDLTVNVRFTLVGRTTNALEIVGVLVLLVLLYLYIVKYKEIGPVFNRELIFVFIAIYIFAAIAAYLDGRVSILGSADYLIRLIDGYLMYFVAILYLRGNARRMEIFKVIWFSLFIVSILNTTTYFLGNYNIDVTSGITRFGGLYNDPGSPSYLATICVLFGALYLEKKKAIGEVPLFIIVFFAATLALWIFILALTITKSAVLMAIVFSIMYWGLFKRKLVLVVPVIIFGGYLLYTEVDVVQTRLANEVYIITAEEVTAADLDRVGTGRVSRMRRLLNMYVDELDVMQKLLGTSRTFGSHNQYISFLLCVGLIGLVVFLIIVGRFYVRLRQLYAQTRLPEYFFAQTLLLCLLALSLSGSPFEYTTILWYLMILLGVVNIRWIVVPAKR